MAAHHGLEWAVAESTLAEDPGSHDEHTFYVTNMREPVSQNEDINSNEGRSVANFYHFFRRLRALGFKIRQSLQM